MAGPAAGVGFTAADGALVTATGGGGLEVWSLEAVDEGGAP
jgi:hypothetical protein